jgi:hypothetical protein
MVTNLNSNFINGASYSTGTWTPIMKGVFGADGSTTYTTQTGSYTQIGNIVYAYFKMVWTATTASGFMGVGGFPLAAGTPVTFGECQTLGLLIPSPYNIVQIALTGGTIGLVVSPATKATSTGSTENLYGPWASGTVECSIVYSR